MVRNVLSASLLYLAVSGPALAMGSFRPNGSGGGHGPGGVHGSVQPTPVGSPQQPHSVPEIDASSGLLAMGAVACLLLLVWERRRRQSAQVAKDAE